MATIRTVAGKDGTKRYQVQIRLAGHEPLFETFDRLTDARDWAQQVEADIKRGHHFPRVERRTVADAVKRFEQEILPGKAESTRSVWRVYLRWWKDRLGALALVAVTAEDVRQSLEALRGHGRGNGPVSIRRHVELLNRLFVKSVEWGWAAECPLKKVELPAEPAGRVRFLDREELSRLLSSCQASRHPALYPAVLLALSTGCRRGEMFQLTWERVDLGRGHVTLAAGTTKSRKARGVPLVGPVLHALREYGQVRRLDSDRVFPATRGGAGAVDLRRAFQRALDQAKITDFHWHDLRHTAASYMIMNGAALSTVAKLLGHSTVEMTQRYSHLADEFLRAEVERMTRDILR